MSKFDRFKLRFSRNKIPSKQFHIKPEEQRACLISLLWNVFSELCRKAFRNLVLWRISTSYMNFFVHALVFFFFYVHLFAILIFWVITALYNSHHVECANSNQDWFYGGTNSVRHNMEIAFELSWITFTTVGYGNVAPSASSSGCWGLRYLCAFEAFIGLVFFSLLGAIFFTKIGLTFGEAPITFSRALCLKFNADSDAFPVLEMQIVHNKANQEGHEILKASLLCMVAIDVPFFKGSSSTARNSKTISQSMDVHRRPSVEDVKHQPSFYSHSRGTKQMSYTVKLEGGEHPYFNRVWHCHHILNGDSPLLSDIVKEEIRKSGGWPSGRRSANGIREALVHFHTMVGALFHTSHFSPNHFVLVLNLKYYSCYFLHSSSLL